MTNDHFPLRKFCGERHPLLKCPEFDVVETARALIKEARADVAKGMAQVNPEGGDLFPVAPVLPGLISDRVIQSAGGSPLTIAEIADNIRPIADVPPAESLDHGPKLADPLALPAPLAATKHRRGPPPDPKSENTLEPWHALGISRRTYYRRKKVSP